VGDLGRAPLDVRKRLDAAMFGYMQRLAPLKASAIMMIRAFGDKQMREP